MATKITMKTGKLENFTSIGCYAIIYYGKDAQGEIYTMCGDCANDPDFRPEIFAAESSDMHEHVVECEHCHKHLQECWKHEDCEDCEDCGECPVKVAATA